MLNEFYVALLRIPARGIIFFKRFYRLLVAGYDIILLRKLFFESFFVEFKLNKLFLKLTDLLVLNVNLLLHVKLKTLPVGSD